jgi:uncharacterized membrane protein
MHALAFWNARGVYYRIPATNFAGWFAASLLLFLLLASRSPTSNRVARTVGLSIVLFFTLLSLAHGLLLAALAGGTLVVFHFVVSDNTPGE